MSYAITTLACGSAQIILGLWLERCALDTPAKCAARGVLLAGLVQFGFSMSVLSLIWMLVR